jgi:putative IMPACT (imprinted ancient) family translation regulator
VHEVITLAGRGRCEIDKIQGSRFIASAGPVSSAQEIEAFLSEVRREFPISRMIRVTEP